MRTTLDIPEPLLEEARRLLGFKSKTDTVVVSLQELIRKELIDSWLEPIGNAGERFGMGDLLIAALASEHDATLWSLDRDFERLARLGLITLHSPAAARKDRDRE